ncbi:MAG TPA: response regulator [Azospirillaceae bacterium]|nr:response regulator [Azospirillaceae bacterium]
MDATDNLSRETSALRFALASICDGFITADSSLIVKYFSDSYRRIYGLPDDIPIAGQPLAEVIRARLQRRATLPRDLDAEVDHWLWSHGRDASANLTDIAADGRRLRLIRRPLPDGGFVETVRVLDAASPVRDGGDAPLHHPADLLSERHLRHILAHTPVGYALADALTNEVVDANAAFQEITGHTLEELLGRRPQDFLVPSSQALISRKQEVARSETASRRYEVMGRRKDGTLAHLGLNTTTLFDDDGQPQYGFVFATDLTPLREAVERERRERRCAENANQAKSTFLAMMSHEIRTPLNAVLGMTEMLRESGLVGKQKLYVDILNEAGEHLSELLNDILEFSKADAQEIVLDEVAFELVRVVQAAVNLFSSRAAEKGLGLGAVIAPETPRYCRGDAVRLRQILINLLSNALKFTESGTILVEVCPAPDTQDGSPEVRFSVTDTGRGIPPDQLDAIFEPFIQADSSDTRRHGGIGLGLAICKRLVGLMGGRIWAQGVPGGGARLSFTVALSPLEALPEVPADLVAEGPQPVCRSGVVRILLADDSLINQRVVTEFLDGLPVRLDIAGDGRQALAMTTGQRYDLVIMDIQMPEMDGCDAARAIRRAEAERNQPPVPIVALTAGAFRETREAALEAGCTQVLLKPVKRRTLLKVLNEQLGVGLGPAFHQPAQARPLDLGDFLIHAQADIARLHKALDKGSRETVQRLVHQIKGHAMIFGLDRLTRHLQHLERAVRADDEARATPLLNDLSAMLAGLEDAWTVSRGTPARISSTEPEPEAEPLTRILIAEDHVLVRHGIRMLLAAEPELTVVAEVEDGISCLRLAMRLRPDIVLMDLAMPRMSGAEAIAAIKKRLPDTRILVLTASQAEVPLVEALAAGADGILVKTADRWALIAAIRALRRGDRYVDASLSTALQEALHRGTVPQGPWQGGLSRRERQVLKLVAEGFRNREIGEQLAISAKTVEKHRASLMRKLGATTAAELAGFALRQGLLAPL